MKTSNNTTRKHSDNFITNALTADLEQLMTSGLLPADLKAVKIELAIRETVSKIKSVNVFDMLDDISSFKSDIDLINASIALSAPVKANDVISNDKARLTMINRNSRTKRFTKINKLSDYQIALIAANATPEKIETTAIYAVDKVIQLSKFLTGNTSIFGRGKNNTAIYAITGLAKSGKELMTTSECRAQLELHGQPIESSATQASSSLKALLSLNCLSNPSSGQYIVNTESKLMTLLLDTFK